MVNPKLETFYLEPFVVTRDILTLINEGKAAKESVGEGYGDALRLNEEVPQALIPSLP